MLKKLGFSVIELLITMVILGALALIALPIYEEQLESTALVIAKRDTTNLITLLSKVEINDQVYFELDINGNDIYAWDNYSDSDNNGFLDRNGIDIIILGKKIPVSEDNEFELYGIDCNGISSSAYQLKTLITTKCLNAECTKHPAFEYNSCTDSEIKKSTGFSYINP